MIVERVWIAGEACGLLTDILAAPVLTDQLRDRAAYLIGALDGPPVATVGPVREYNSDGDTITNASRVEAAYAGVQAACRARGDGHDDVDEDGILDLLCDLGHLCDATVVDFEKSILWALRRWREER